MCWRAEASDLSIGSCQSGMQTTVFLVKVGCEFAVEVVLRVSGDEK